MSYLPQQIHDYLRQARRSNKGSTITDSRVVTGIAKEYTRMVQITLPEPDSDMTLKNALVSRRSCRDTSELAPTLEQYGEIFGLSLRQDRDSLHRPYPSGGALYPIEAYLVSPLEDDTSYVFHYSPKTHTLEKLWKLPEDVGTKDLFGGTGTMSVPAAIILTARWFRSSGKYGDFSYMLAMLEAGHIAQNLLLAATAANVCACPIGGFEDEVIVEAFDLPTDHEQPVYGIIISQKK